MTGIHQLIGHQISPVQLKGTNMWLVLNDPIKLTQDIISPRLYKVIHRDAYVCCLRFITETFMCNQPWMQTGVRLYVFKQ